MVMALQDTDLAKLEQLIDMCQKKDLLQVVLGDITLTFNPRATNHTLPHDDVPGEWQPPAADDPTFDPDLGVFRSQEEVAWMKSQETVAEVS